MFISVGNRILNGKRITTIEVDRDTPSEINYYFNDGGMIKEEFKTSEEASERLESLGEDKTFIATNDERLVNAMYIQNVEIDFINKKRVVYYLYGGAPVKELYKTEAAAKEALESIKSKLETMDFGGGSGEGETVDLTPYLKKSVAEETYAKIESIPDISGLASKEDIQSFITKTVDDLVNYYNKTEIDDKIDTITTIGLKVVDSVDKVVEENVIYFVSGQTKKGNLYKEYILVNGTPEEIGATEINLTDYLKKSEAENIYAKKNEIPSVPTKLSELTNDQDFTTKTYVDELVGDIESLLGGI